VSELFLERPGEDSYYLVLLPAGRLDNLGNGRTVLELQHGDHGRLKSPPAGVARKVAEVSPSMNSWSHQADPAGQPPGSGPGVMLGSGPINFDLIVIRRRLLIRGGVYERSVFIE
jgi:hypothetical protein